MFSTPWGENRTQSGHLHGDVVHCFISSCAWATWVTAWATTAPFLPRNLGRPERSMSITVGTTNVSGTTLAIVSIRSYSVVVMVTGHSGVTPPG